MEREDLSIRVEVWWLASCCYFVVFLVNILGIQCMLLICVMPWDNYSSLNMIIERRLLLQGDSEKERSYRTEMEVNEVQALVA